MDCEGGATASLAITKTLRTIGVRLLPHPLTPLPIRQLVIAVFDLWNARLSEKKEALGDHEYVWREHLHNDKFFTWFQGKEEESKCSMAWDWMRKHQPQLTRGAPFPCHSELLDFFDRSDATPGEGSFTSPKSSDGGAPEEHVKIRPTEEAVHFVLAIDVNDALVKLAQKPKLSRTKILERLILNEAEGDPHTSDF